MTIQVPEKIDTRLGIYPTTVRIEELDKYARSLPLLARIPVNIDRPVIDRSIHPVISRGIVVGYAVQDQYYAGDDPEALGEYGWNTNGNSQKQFESEPRERILVKVKSPTSKVVGPFKYHVHRYSQQSVDKATDPWGVKVESVELKHVELPEQLKRTIGKEAEAEREKRAVIIKAAGEVIAMPTRNGERPYQSGCCVPTILLASKAPQRKATATAK